MCDFVNFRQVCLGSIKPGILFRSSHPFPHNQEDTVVSQLAQEAGINTILNLSDNAAVLKNEVSCPWYQERILQKNVIALDMNFNLLTKSFGKKLARGIRFITKHEGPYFIHCQMGIERTGLVCALLAALMGAKLDDIITDYAASFNCYDEINIRKTMQEINTRILLNQLAQINRGCPVTDDNLYTGINVYFRDTVGLSDKTMLSLTELLSDVKQNKAQGVKQ